MASPLIFSEYCLKLSDRCRWSLTGTSDCVPWVGRLASIMELRETESDGSPKLIFATRESADHEAGRLSGCLGARLSHQEGRKAGWSVSHPDAFHLWCADYIPDVLCEVSNHGGDEFKILNMWYALLPIYQRSTCKGGLPFHAGLITLRGRGFLLAGSGAAGKSTCCRRVPGHWRPLCDDETLVVLNTHKQYRAHPFPTWSDYLWKDSEKTWKVEYSVPLSGVFFLEQSRVDEAVPLGRGEAAVLMTESASQVYEKFWRKIHKEDRKKHRRELFNNACAMAQDIPAYRLRVSLEGKFWEKMEKVLGF